MSNKGEQYRNDLRVHADAANASNQVRALANILPELDLQDIQERIAKLSGSTYQQVLGAVTDMPATSEHEVRILIETIEGEIQEIIATENIPVTRVYIDDIRSGRRVTLAQDFYVPFEVPKTGGCSVIRIKKGAEVYFPSSPGNDLCMETGDFLLVITRERFPTTGLLIEE